MIDPMHPTPEEMAQMLETLTLGAHTVTILFDNGEVDVRLTIQAAHTSPRTGDNSAMGRWLCLTCLTGLGLLWLFPARRRKTKR